MDALLKGSVHIGDKIISVGAPYRKEYTRFVNQWIKEQR
jgi:hypothetical protein